jgi:hypothetical protein
VSILKRGGVAIMRYLIGIVLGLFLSVANADVFKCISGGGEVIFSDTPCDEGEEFSKTRPSESAGDLEAAKREIQRQKEFVERSSATHGATGGIAVLPDESSPPPASPPELTFPGGSSSGSGSVNSSPKGMPSLPRN